MEKDWKILIISAYRNLAGADARCHCPARLFDGVHRNGIGYCLSVLCGCSIYAYGVVFPNTVVDSFFQELQERK